MTTTGILTCNILPKLGLSSRAAPVARAVRTELV
jgi:hypothetical protein